MGLRQKNSVARSHMLPPIAAAAPAAAISPRTTVDLVRELEAPGPTNGSEAVGDACGLGLRGRAMASPAHPGVQLRAERIHGAHPVVLVAVNGHRLPLLPALDGGHVPVEICRDFLPRIQPVPVHRFSFSCHRGRAGIVAPRGSGGKGRHSTAREEMPRIPRFTVCPRDAGLRLYGASLRTRRQPQRRPTCDGDERGEYCSARRS